ncbi:MAG: cytochrome c biogenesis protein CcsA [Acidobacteria bacterium]|nr:cytochrome c biogenesis protein CcsA [Acidobacteriota bacterium]MBI3278849.1 cytochrome c biogenesis protein CcsA [Acidobacteriota bacterium]
MREKLMYVLLAGSGALLVWNLSRMLLYLPDEAAQGAIYRIIFFHVPGAFTFSLAVFSALVSSVLYLITRRLPYDTFAASATEIGLAFGAVNLVTGMIWARIIWGIWWAWDPRLTSMLISWLMYAGYLMLRRAIDEPTQRARNAAVLNIFTFPGVIITYKAIDWWRTQHPGPVLSFRSGGGRMDPAMEATLYWNFLALLLLAAALLMVRMRQETTRRELDALRREAHAL